MVDRKGKKERKRAEEEARAALTLVQAELDQVRRGALTRSAELEEKLATADDEVRTLVSLLGELGGEVESVFEESKRMTSKANAIKCYFESLSAGVGGNKRPGVDVTPLEPGNAAKERPAEEKTRERKGELPPPSENRIATPRAGDAEGNFRRRRAVEPNPSSRGFGGDRVNGGRVDASLEEGMSLSRNARARGGHGGRGRGGYGRRGQGNGNGRGRGWRGGRGGGFRGARGGGGNGSRRAERGAHRGRRW